MTYFTRVFVLRSPYLRVNEQIVDVTTCRLWTVHTLVNTQMHNDWHFASMIVGQGLGQQRHDQDQGILPTATHIPTHCPSFTYSQTCQLVHKQQFYASTDIFRISSDFVRFGLYVVLLICILYLCILYIQQFKTSTEACSYCQQKNSMCCPVSLLSIFGISIGFDTHHLLWGFPLD